MKKILLLTCCITISALAFTQPLKIPLTEKYGNSFVTRSSASAVDAQDKSVYSGFDSSKYEKFTIRKIFFSGFQYLLENNFIDANMSREKAMEWHKKYSDTTFFYYQKLPRNYAAYLYATGKDGLIHFTMDANNNLRFDDDKEYVFDTAGTKKYHPIVKVEFDYFDGKSLQKITVPYTVNAYTSRLPAAFINGKKIISDVQLNCEIYHEGVYKSGNRKYVFNIVKESMGVYKKKPVSLAVQAFDKKGNGESFLPFQYTTTQIMEFDQGLYKIDSLTADALYLYKIEKTLYDGGRVGSMAYNLEGADIMDGKSFSLKRNRGKYSIINFWGSWCGPCIAELPELKALHQKHNDVSFVSIAADYPKDIDKLKALITEKKLTWPQLCFDREMRQEGIFWDYKIVGFPTTLLVNSNGKIVMRGTGAKVLSEIDEYLTRKKKS